MTTTTSCMTSVFEGLVLEDVYTIEDKTAVILAEFSGETDCGKTLLHKIATALANKQYEYEELMKRYKQTIERCNELVERDSATIKELKEKNALLEEALATNEESENGGAYWSSKYFKLFEEQKAFNHDIEERLVSVKAALASI